MVSLCTQLSGGKENEPSFLGIDAHGGGLPQGALRRADVLKGRLMDGQAAVARREDARAFCFSWFARR